MSATAIVSKGFDVNCNLPGSLGSKKEATKYYFSKKGYRRNYKELCETKTGKRNWNQRM